MLVCKRCGWGWEAKTEKLPKVCARCKSEKWQTEKNRKWEDDVMLDRNNIEDRMFKILNLEETEQIYSFEMKFNTFEWIVKTTQYLKDSSGNLMTGKDNSGYELSVPLVLKTFRIKHTKGLEVELLKLFGIEDVTPIISMSVEYGKDNPYFPPVVTIKKYGRVPKMVDKQFEQHFSERLAKDHLPLNMFKHATLPGIFELISNNGSTGTFIEYDLALFERKPFDTVEYKFVDMERC